MTEPGRVAVAVDEHAVDPVLGRGPCLSVEAGPEGFRVHAAEVTATLPPGPFGPVRPRPAGVLAGQLAHHGEAFAETLLRAGLARRDVGEIGPQTPWTVAVWDERARELRVTVSAHVGGGGALWAWDGKRVLVSTHAAGVVARMNPAPGVDRRWVAALMINLSPTDDLSPFAGVRHLRPGWELWWRPGRAPSVRRWFRPDEEGQDGPWRPADVRAAYWQALDASLADLVPPGADVGVLVSGGLDSTLVASSVAPLVRGNGLVLHGFTQSPAEVLPDQTATGWEADDLPYVRLLADTLDGLVVHPLTNPGRITSVDLWGDIFEAGWMPQRNGSNLPWIWEGMCAAQEVGVPVILHGGSGNAVLSPETPWPYRDLLRHGQLAALAGSLRARHGASREESLPQVVYRGAVMPVLPDAAQRLAIRLAGRAPAPSLGSTSFLRRGLADEVGLGREYSHPPSETWNRAAWWSWVTMGSAFLVGWGPAAVGGLRWWDGLGSRDLQRLAASLPARAWVATGESRGVARTVLHGRVPEVIRMRQTRGRQDADWWPVVEGRRVDHVAVLDSVAADPVVADIFDVPALRELISRWPGPEDPEMHSLLQHHALRALGVAAWITWWNRRRTVGLTRPGP